MSTIDVRNIGRLLKRGLTYRIYCATCGKGKQAPVGIAPRGVLIADLERNGWNKGGDGLWRCGCLERDAASRAAVAGKGTQT